MQSSRKKGFLVSSASASGARSQGRRAIKKIGNPDASAAAFNRIRKAHETEVAEDYVELIDDLIEAQGEARLVELARYMGVNKATASKVIGRLQRQGLVQSKPYRAIFLTKAGRALAARARARHRIVYDFLVWLGVDEETAAADAEGMEHHVSDQTLALFDRLTRPQASQSKG